MRGVAPILAGLAVLAMAPAVQAQVTVTRAVATAPVLGNVLRGTTTTQFQVSGTGAVTRLSGDAIRLSNASVTAPSFTISCGLLNLNGLCAIRRMRITITATGHSADASIVKFHVAGLSGASFYQGQPADAQSMTFDLNPIGILTVATITLGMTVELKPGATTGVETFSYSVRADLL